MPQAPSRLFNRNFTLLWQGQLVSQIGSQAVVVAMMLWTKAATGSAGIMGLLLMLSSLPAILAGPLAGAVADRRSRKAILVGSDLLRGLASLFLAALVFADRLPTAVLVALFVAVTVFNSVAGAFFQPAVSAAIPDLVPPTKLSVANSLRAISAECARSAGRAFGGLLYLVGGAALLCAADGLSFLFAAASESCIAIPQQLSRRPRTWQESLATYAASTQHGLAYVWQQAGMRTYLMTAAAVNFFFMPVFVMLPFYAADVLQARADGYGFLTAASGLGGVAGTGVAGLLKMRGGLRGVAVPACLLTTSVLIGSLGFVRWLPAALGCFFVIGMLSGYINVSVITVFQLAAPPELRGRVMALLFTVSSAVVPLGMGAGGLLGEVMGKDVPLIYQWCGLGALLAASAGTARRDFRALLAGEQEEDRGPGPVSAHHS